MTTSEELHVCPTRLVAHYVSVIAIVSVLVEISVQIRQVLATPRYLLQ